MRIAATVLCALVVFGSSFAEVTGEEVSYTSGTVTMKGYLAYDNSTKEQRPAVLVVHEWWGHNAYARKRAEMLAELGYTALAVDMYGDGKTADHPGDAGKFAGEIFKNMPEATQRFLAAMQLLKDHETVDQSRVAAIGYCFGGGVVLAMARLGIDLKGVVSFHGGIESPEPAKKGAVRAAVLVCNGADDPFVTKEQIENFKKEMKAAKVNYSFKSYPGAKHSFTNPAADEVGKKFNLPLAYSEEADAASWNDMKQFLTEVFAGK